LALSTEVTFLSTWKTTPPHKKKDVILIICPPVGAFNILEVTVEFFALFKAKFDAGSQFFRSAIFLGLPKVQVEQHTLLLNKVLLNSHAYYCLIPSRK